MNDIERTVSAFFDGKLQGRGTVNHITSTESRVSVRILATASYDFMKRESPAWASEIGRATGKNIDVMVSRKAAL